MRTPLQKTGAACDTGFYIIIADANFQMGGYETDELAFATIGAWRPSNQCQKHALGDQK